ncbi:MAG: hypothetical protein OXU54_07920 [Gammaproteobacteria bacterium]|nr:hypothetical protein [Gammaproteobacteria bacterium]
MDDTKLDIKFFSWPYQWIYWPAYMALAKTIKEQYHDIVGALFSQCTYSSDKEILDALKKPTNGGPTIKLALCGRPTGCTPNGQEGMDTPPFEIATVLWRLPHWRISYRQEEGGTQMMRFAHGPDSTSGDYVRKELREFGGNAVINRLDKNAIEKLVTDIKNWKNTEVAHFTPFHKIHQGLEKEELYGPGIGRVSSFSTPTRSFDDTDEHIFFRKLREHLSFFIQEMYITRGQKKEMEKLIEKYEKDDPDDPLSVLKELKLECPQYLTSELRALFLCEFVKRGAYIPYHAWNKLIGDDIRRALIRRLTQLSKSSRVLIKLVESLNQPDEEDLSSEPKFIGTDKIGNQVIRLGSVNLDNVNEAARYLFRKTIEDQVIDHEQYPYVTPGMDARKDENNRFLKLTRQLIGRHQCKEGGSLPKQRMALRLMGYLFDALQLNDRIKKYAEGYLNHAKKEHEKIKSKEKSRRKSKEKSS